MSDEMMLSIWLLSFLGGLALLCIMMSVVTNFISKRNDRKHRKEHPEFFRLYNDFNDKADTACRFNNMEIAARKRKVKSMLEEEPYWPRQVREQKMEEVEKLRREIYTAECMKKALDKEAQEARQKVADYVQKYNIKWAGDWS